MPDPSTSAGSPRPFDSAQGRPEPAEGRAESRGDWTEHLRPRLARLRLSAAREAEIIEELSQHLDQRYDELRCGGTRDTDARRLAIDELLEPGVLADHMRSLRQARVPPPITPGAPRRFLLGDLWQDLRYTVRTLTRQRVFGAAAVLTLALGIGANSAIFALVDATLLRSLPFPDPHRLVMVWERMRRRSEAGWHPSTSTIGTSAVARSMEWPGSFPTLAAW